MITILTCPFTLFTVRYVILNKNTITNCKLLGFTDNVEEHYEYFDAFVLASKMEGTPISILEAMATGTIVFSNMVGAIPDILEDQVTGYRIYNNPEIDSEIIRQNIDEYDTINEGIEYPFVSYIKKRLIKKYQSSRSMPNALNCVSTSDLVVTSV